MNVAREIDEYIASFPENVQVLLKELRSIIKQAAPAAEEIISYKMPAYRQESMLVYFAGYKNHVGLYPTASPILVFAEELKTYKTSKGAIQFKLDEPLPSALITRIVNYKIEENRLKLAKRMKNK